MFFIIGISPKKKDLGTVGGYRVFMTCTALFLFFIPVFSWNRMYFAADADNRMWQLPYELGRDIERGRDAVITPSDLTEVRPSVRGEEDIAGNGHRNGSDRYFRGDGSTGRGTRKRCPFCGYTTGEDFIYCPKCAEKLEDFS